jgi:hypothetical protein
MTRHLDENGASIISRHRDSSSSRPRTLWIGGTSALARTYVNRYGCNDLIMVGIEERAPDWLEACPHYVRVDLTDVSSVTLLFENLQQHNLLLDSIDSIIISVRAPLVSIGVLGDNSHQHTDLLHGMEALIRQAVALLPLSYILHISSVAAVNHLQAQVNINEDSVMPPLSDYTAAYDVFKRQCEELITNIVVCNGESHNNNNMISYTHLRISGVFSDHSTNCIQVGALNIQSFVGQYLTTKIDMNSSRNVGAAIQVLLDRMRRRRRRQSGELSPVYYYTRPSSIKQPIPYGDYLLDYLKANNIWYTIWLPCWLVGSFLWFINILATYMVPSLQPINYLLQVSTREHSFDNSRFLKDFPEIQQHEESIYECFVRRRLQQQQQHVANGREHVVAPTTTTQSNGGSTKYEKKEA